MVFNNCIPRGGLPVQNESSGLRSARDGDSLGGQWKKNKPVTSQTNANTRAISNLQTQVNKVKRRVLGMPPSTFTQEKPMFPFRIYKPNPLPPDGTAVTTFDSNGAQVAAIVDSTVATNLPPNGGTMTVNPTTDAWRFWNVRTGRVQIRNWFSYVVPFTDVSIGDNYSRLQDCFLGTDDIFPLKESSQEYDDPTTTVNYATGGTTLIIPGAIQQVGGSYFIGFAIWIQIVPDLSADDDGNLAIMGRTFDGDTGVAFPDISPLVIPIGIIQTTVTAQDTEPVGTDLTVMQFVFDHILNRFPVGMYGNGQTIYDPTTGQSIDIPPAFGGFGILSYRGDWATDDIQDMVFYPGDIIKATVDMSAFSAGLTLINFWMATTVGFTSDPSQDDSFILMSGSIYGTPP